VDEDDFFEGGKDEIGLAGEGRSDFRFPLCGIGRIRRNMEGSLLLTDYGAPYDSLPRFDRGCG